MIRFFAWVKEGMDRRQAVTTGLLAVFVYLLAAVLFYRPMVLSWKNKLEEVDASKLKLVRYERLVSQKSALLTELSGYKERYTRKLSHDEEVSIFLKQLEEMVGKSGLKVNNLRPIPYDENKDLDTLVIELTIEGEMEQYLDFLHSLATSEDLLDIRAMSVQRRTAGEGHLGVTAEATKTLFIG